MPKGTTGESWSSAMTKLSKDYYTKAGKAIAKAVQEPPKVRGNQGKRIER